MDHRLICKHITPFMERGVKTINRPVESMNDLLSIEEIAGYKKVPAAHLKHFEKFSLGKITEKEYNLIAEYDKGHNTLVAAVLVGDVSTLGLNDFEPLYPGFKRD